MRDITENDFIQAEFVPYNLETETLNLTEEEALNILYPDRVNLPKKEKSNRLRKEQQ